MPDAFDETTDRRAFIKQTAAAGAGLGLAGSALAAPAVRAAGGSPAERVTVAVMGVNSRGNALAKSFAKTPDARVAYIADVDERAVDKTVADIAEIQDRPPEGVEDFRRALDDADVNALATAAPDHWHAPAALMALDAGKHVYVEKPCSHNPREGEMLVAAQKKYPDQVIQMGNQQRSALRSQEIVERIRSGDVIGDAYYGRAYYNRNRGPTNLKRPAEVPDWLNYDLWQGPVPNKPYAENLIHYNWHWFWHWGTGEICNNGTHEIDVCRWALDVDYPTRAASNGGRYAYDDDWEAFDTQVAGFDFAGEKSIAWDGRSSSSTPPRGGSGPGSGGRGAAIHGTEGTVLIDRSGYAVHDMEGKLVEKSVRGDGQIDQTNIRGGGGMTDRHTTNFVRAIRGEAEPHSPIDEARKSVLLCHLGNIAQRRKMEVDVDPETGRPRGEEAMQLWSRAYAPQWQEKLMAAAR